MPFQHTKLHSHEFVYTREIIQDKHINTMQFVPFRLNRPIKNDK